MAGPGQEGGDQRWLLTLNVGVEVLVGVLVDVGDLQTEKTQLVYKTD